MRKHWDFAPLEYVVGWRAFGWDMLSYPLQYRPAAKLDSDYERDCAQAAAVFESQWDDDLYGAFVTLGAAHARVHACGFAGPDNDRKIRVHAAARDRMGVVVVQDPGPDHHCGGTIHLSRIPVTRVAERVVAALPATNPGRQNVIEVATADLEPDDEAAPGSWLEPARARNSPVQQLSRFVRRPRVGAGRIEVYPGPTVNDRTTRGGRDMYWVDIADDGRYLARENRDSVTVGPVDAADLTSTLQQLVTKAARAYVRATVR